MGKDEKSQSDWKRKLSPGAYHILRKKGTEKPFQNKYFDSKKKELMSVPVAVSLCLNLKINMILAQGGPVFTNRLVRNILKLKRT